jgi:hypothetical protein
MNMISKKQQHRRSDTNKLVRAYLSGPNIPQRKFCERHQIPLSTFQYNLRKHRKQQSENPEKKSARFVPVTLAENEPTAHTRCACEIICPNGLIIRFDAAPEPEYLLSLLAAGVSQS